MGYMHAARLSVITAGAVRRELGQWARSRGLQLDAIFTESTVGDRAALHELYAEMQQRAHTRGRAVVVVPSVEHFAVNPRLAEPVLAELERVGAEVYVMDDAFSGRLATPSIAKLPPTPQAPPDDLSVPGRMTARHVLVSAETRSERPPAAVTSVATFLERATLEPAAMAKSASRAACEERAALLGSR